MTPLAGHWDLTDETGEYSCQMQLPGAPQRLTFTPQNPDITPQFALRTLHSATYPKDLNP